MRISFLDNLSWQMAQVYGSVTDQLLINISRYFKRLKPDSHPPNVNVWQGTMLNRIGQLVTETIKIIKGGLGGADEALKETVQESVKEGQREAEQNAPKDLPPDRDPRNTKAFQAFYRQSADKLNLVNTVMLDSTLNAYRYTVSDIVGKINRTQQILNEGAEQVILGTSSWNKAVDDAVDKMVNNGLTGFIDHGGHHWSPEAYAAMVIRTTSFNAARAAVWEECEQMGTDLYQVSSHIGARPLCYPWQGKVISREDRARDVKDLYGNTVHVYAQSETTYGQPAGLFGINCGHFPSPFFDGTSTIKKPPQDKAENAKSYAESQQQRALERKLRAEKRDLAIMKARDYPEDEIKAQRKKVREASKNIAEFCEKTGRIREREREYTPINAEFPEGV